MPAIGCRHARSGVIHASRAPPARVVAVRAADFKQCPCSTDSAPSTACPNPRRPLSCAARLVHAVLEQLYAMPSADRVFDTAISLVDPAWAATTAANPDLVDQLTSDQQAKGPVRAQSLLSGYYRLEDPTRFDPQSCEQRIEVELADGVVLRGYVDRIDVAATGEMRVVDYKTGRAPSAVRAMAEAKALFQMKFYAVALLRSSGVLATRLRLIYLADGQILDYEPELDELERFEKTLTAIWRAIESAGATGEFRANQTRLCAWCTHQSVARRSAVHHRPIRVGPIRPGLAA